jgi:exonuclease III
VLHQTPTLRTIKSLSIPGSGLSVGSLNARSINNKSATITNLIDELRLDVLAIQESWHENSDALSLRSCVPPGYTVVDVARAQAYDSSDVVVRAVTGGGVAVIYRAEYKMHKVTTLPTATTFEFVCCRLSAGTMGDVILLSVYRPGSKSITNAFFDE